MHPKQHPHLPAESCGYPQDSQFPQAGGGSLFEYACICTQNSIRIRLRKVADICRFRSFCRQETEVYLGMHVYAKVSRRGSKVYPACTPKKASASACRKLRISGCAIFPGERWKSIWVCIYMQKEAEERVRYILHVHPQQLPHPPAESCGYPQDPQFPQVGGGSLFEYVCVGERKKN